jgi:hypothetical protein
VQYNGSERKPLYRTLGRSPTLSKADKTALFEYLLAQASRLTPPGRYVTLERVRGFCQLVYRISSLKRKQVDMKRDDLWTRLRAWKPAFGEPVQRSMGNLSFILSMLS